MSDLNVSKTSNIRVTLERARFFLIGEIFDKQIDIILDAHMGEQAEKDKLVEWTLNIRDELIKHLEYIEDPVEIETALVVFYLAKKSEWNLLNARVQYSMMAGEFNEESMFQLSTLSLIISTIQLLISYDDVEYVNELIANPLSRGRGTGVTEVPVDRIHAVLECLKDINHSCSTAVGVLNGKNSDGESQELIANTLMRSLWKLQNWVISLNEDTAVTLLAHFESIVKEILQYTSKEASITLEGSYIKSQKEILETLKLIGSNFLRELLLRLLTALSSEGERVDCINLRASIKSGRLVFDIELTGAFPHRIIRESATDPSDIEVSYESMRRQSREQKLEFEFLQTNDHIHWQISSPLKMAVERLLMVRNPDGVFGLYQYLFDRILQPGQVTEHVNGGKLSFIEYNGAVYHLVNILGEDYDPVQHANQSYVYILLNASEHKTAIVAGEVTGLVQTIPEPIPTLLEDDTRFSGVMLTESRELGLIVAPSLFDEKNMDSSEASSNEETVATVA